MASRYVAKLPSDSGPVVGIAVFDRQIVIACGNGVFVLRETWPKGEAGGMVRKLEPIALDEGLADAIEFGLSQKDWGR